MVNIRVASWNVQNFGVSKLNPPGAAPNAVLAVIARFVVNQQVQILGIMEIQGGQGALIGGALTASLNNARPFLAAYQWQFRLSSRQDGGTQEEYLYLWREEAGVLSLDPQGSPVPASLIGVFDESIIADIATTPPHRQDLIDALVASGYIQIGRFKVGNRFRNTARYRIVPAAWQALDALGAARTVNFTPPLSPFVAGLTPAQRQTIANRLYLVDILEFTRYGDRSPYLINFLVGAGNAQKRVMISLVHELGPDDPDRLAAINVMGMSLVLQPAAQDRGVLLMGDFNVTVLGMGFALARDYVRGDNSQGVFGFWPAPGVQRVFAPIFAWSADHADLLGASATSLTTAYLAANDPPASALSSAYDKLILFNGPNAHYVTAANSAVADLMAQSISPAGATPEHGLAALIYGYDKGGCTGEAFAAHIRFNALIAKADSKITQYTVYRNAARSKIKIGTPANSPLRTRVATLTKAVQNFGLIRNGYDTQRTHVIGLVQTLADPTVVVPNGTGVSLASYRFISDHLPVVTDLVA